MRASTSFSSTLSVEFNKTKKITGNIAYAEVLDEILPCDVSLKFFLYGWFLCFLI